MKIEELEDQRSSLERSPATARSTVVLFPLTLVFILLLVVTAHAQLTAGAESIYKAEQNIVSSRLITPPRGLFYDRSGQRLTINESSYSLSIDLKDFQQSQLTDFLNILAPQSGKSVDELQEVISAAKGGKAELLHGLSSGDAILISQVVRSYPVEMVPDVKRKYLFPNEFAQIVGYTGIPDIADLNASYDPQDQIGKYGLEKVLESDLKGVKGKDSSLSGSVEQIASIPGNNVILTIDARWQQALYKILGEQVDRLDGQSGAAVIVDVNSGDIWAYASYPSFDPNRFENGISASDYQALLDDPGRPLVDKVIAMQTSPGSSFKLVSAYAALQNGAIDENTHYYSDRCVSLSEGYPFCEFGKYFIGDLDVVRALTRSSNIFFCESLLKLSHEQGYDKFMEAARALGIGSPTGIVLPNELSGVLASPAEKQKTTNEGWFDGDICNAVIGQGLTTVTPLQMAMVISTIRNGGRYYTPNLISRIVDQQGNVIKSDFTHLECEIPLSDKTRELILNGMYYVVNSMEGTAFWYLYENPGNFYAKTGSVEAFDFSSGKQVNKVDGWIVGTFDYQDKTFGFASNIRYGGGGWNVTQVMQKFSKCLFSDFADGCTEF